MAKTINVALPKGRVGDSIFSLFERADFGCPSVHDGGRRLIFENPQNGMRLFTVKPSAVAI